MFRKQQLGRSLWECGQMMQLIPDGVILVKTSVFVNSPSVFLCSFSEEKLGEAESIFKATNFMLISSSTVLILSE